MLESNLSERAVLMRLSIGLPGEARQDPALTGEVKTEHKLGLQAGKWTKNLYPPEALAAVKKLDNEARAYHAAVTLPFDQGIGILPAALIMEYGDRMRQFKGMRDHLVQSTFLADPQKWIDWAVSEHNGTFDPSLYPGCSEGGASGSGFVHLDADEFRRVMGEKFTFKTQPLPVPNAKHFTDTVSSLLGTDAQSVDLRLRDAAVEAQRELMRRLLEPVKAMAKKLSEQPKGKREDIVFRDTLIGNIEDIVRLAPKLNLSGNPELDDAIKAVETLTRYSAKELRESKATRSEAAKAAEAVVQKLSGYQL